MPNSATYKLEIKTADPAGPTLSTIVTSPRTCTPLDLAETCKNVVLEASGDAVPPAMLECARYMLTDFFAFAHSTGLYNRQRLLWDALGRVTSVEYHQVTQGFFQKQPLPLFDVYFLDGKGRVAVFAHIIQSEAFAAGLMDGERKEKDHLRTVLIRLEKLKAGRGPVGGMAFFCENEFPNNILSEVIKMTNGTDPVGKYESLLPEPWAVPIDLFELSAASGVQLIHPDLSSAKHAPPRPQAQKR
ncbi:MAG TPA: hypothetical protein V6C81_16340 [Planktothrix sp.]